LIDKFFNMVFSFLLQIAFLLLLSHELQATSLDYSNCILSSDFGNNDNVPLVLMPSGNICNSRCKIECNAFSEKSGSVEYNEDIISSCMVQCRSGTIFSSKYRVHSATLGTNGLDFTWKGPTSTGTSCSTSNSAIDSASYNNYDSSIILTSGDSFQINFLNGVGVANEIYLCGNETVKLDPPYTGYTPTDWNNNTSLWNIMDTSIGSWSARNYNFTDTGLDLKDGDRITITYLGQYRNKCVSNQRCLNLDPATNDYNLYIKNPEYPNWPNVYASSSSRIILPGGTLQFATADANGNIDTSAYSNNLNVNFMGLHAGSGYLPNSIVMPNTVRSTDTYYDNGYMHVYKKDAMITFSGTLEGFSPTFSRLGLAHYGDNSFVNNLGGYRVVINRKGCIYKGDRIQYGIGAQNPNSSSSNPTYLTPASWNNISLDDIKSNISFTPGTPGKLFFRINLLANDPATRPVCDSNNTICADSINRTLTLTKAAHTGGQYYILVRKANPAGSQLSMASDIVGKIRNYLFGNNAGTPGIVQNLFNTFIYDSNLISAIRALLVLYIAFTGLSFMIGIAEINQKEAVTRLFKVAIISILITSGESWEFFNTYLFGLFTDGALEMVALVGAPADSSPSDIANLVANPVRIFQYFDIPLNMLFAKQTMWKILAIALSSFSGFLLAIVILLACIIYAMALAKATLIYLISLIGIAILLIMAPIFICFLLFQYTRKMFDAWLKQLASFAFQPIIVFAGINILNNLLIAGLQTTLGFTICFGCLFYVYIPTVTSFCLISNIVSLWSIHSPPDGLMPPMRFVASGFYLLIIAQATFAFCGRGPKLANLLITQSYMAPDLGDVAKRANIVTIAQDGILTMFGRDEAAKAAHKDTVKAYNKTKKSVKELPQRMRNLANNVKKIF
jgi:type IV secretion system protein VirB6